jgi:predicted nucleic acid-binding protein
VILVDSSVWIDHFRHGEDPLSRLLNARQVLTHPCVIGELALGNLHQRDLVLGLLEALPHASAATDAEMLRFFSEQILYGIGIGYVDAHLLAAARLTPDTTIWTRDKRLRAAAQRLSLAAGMPD